MGGPGPGGAPGGSVIAAMDAPALDFRSADPATSPARDLIEAMIDELTQWYGRIDGPGTPSATPADFAAPAGVFLVGYGDGEAVTGGGVKRLAEGVGEIKRMYVVEAWRGRGVASALLSALEFAAVDLGYRTVRLDTGPRQHAARGLYERRGYAPIPDYNGNRLASFWGEKHLSVP